MRTVISVFTVVAALSLFSCGPTQGPCSAATCNGCCDFAGQCQPGSQPQACGVSGNLCTTCVATQTCQAGACQGSSGSGGGGGGGTTGGGGGSTGGGGGGSTGGGGGTTMTDAQRVTTFCEKTRLAGCANWFTSQAQCEDAMRRTQAALCEVKWVAETNCLSQTQLSDWVCDAFGEPHIAGTLCRDEYGFGSYCRVSVASPACYSGACQFNSDCPSGMSCNDKTAHCFDTQASCPGLPCKFNADCPSGQTCNNALEQCVRS